MARRIGHLARDGHDATRKARQPATLFTYVALAQSLYYASTAIWSIVSIGTFQRVTGPKTDLWLVKTVGVLLGIIAGVLGLAGLRRRATPEAWLLGAGSAAGLASIDIVYVMRRRIGRIYLLDAGAEFGLLALWAWIWRRTQRRQRGRR